MKVGGLPVMKVKCKTCPFREGGDQGLANTVIERNLFESQQICHGTEGENREANHRCRGAFDICKEIYTRAGMEHLISEELRPEGWVPTDGEMGIKKIKTMSDKYTFKGYGKEFTGMELVEVLEAGKGYSAGKIMAYYDGLFDHIFEKWYERSGDVNRSSRRACRHIMNLCNKEKERKVFQRESGSYLVVPEPNYKYLSKEGP